jgi:hypothetical protein
VRGHVRVITRLRLDANLFKPAPARKRNQRGRPPLKGSALPKLSTVLKNAKTKWTTAIVPQWYGDQQRTLQTATGTFASNTRNMHSEIWKSDVHPALLRPR